MRTIQARVVGWSFYCTEEGRKEGRQATWQNVRAACGDALSAMADGCFADVGAGIIIVVVVIVALAIYGSLAVDGRWLAVAAGDVSK